MHKGLKRFQIKSKIVDDAQFIRQRETQIHMLHQQMRDAGYVVVLDLGPYWSTKLNSDGTYDAVMTLYGKYLGKRKAWLFAGVDIHGTLYPAQPTQSNKSSQS